jgi:hypothetical protein
MKKQLLVILLAACCGLAHADEYGDAIKAWENKDFAKALPVFTKLANAGNPAAQLQLGEMYGFGEGVPEDMNLANSWLKMAQANGNRDAAASIALMQERSRLKPEIVRHTTSFEGGDVKFSNFNCVRPVIPAQSSTNAEIKKVTEAVNAWMACYGRFAETLNQSLPPGKKIPAEVSKVMNAAEYALASGLMDKSYALIAATAQRDAEQIVAERDAWTAKTGEFVAKNNAEAAQNLARYEANKLNREAEERAAATATSATRQTVIAPSGQR